MKPTPSGLLRFLAHRWRSSLQVRVVATTLLVSMVVVTLVGLFVLGRVSTGLLDAKRRAALAESAAGLSYAQSQLAQADRTDPVSLDRLLENLAVVLDGRGSPAGLYDVALVPTSVASALYASRAFDTADVPAALRAAVGDELVQAYAYGRIKRDNGTERALVVGAPLSAAYQLYYVFSLNPEDSSLTLVRRALLLGGLALVVLLAGVAAIVTRTVVTPVQLAARVAARLADGHLEERMAVRGEDDLAALAKSFNLMARSLQRQIGQLEELSRVARRFTADVSHELRTPLTTVRMAADVLHDARSGFPPETARAAELLQSELNRFEQLLVDLLEISRYDAQVAVLEAEVCDLGQLVRSAAHAAEPLAARKGSRLDLSGVPDAPVLAEVDPRRVQRILRNLITNAIENGEGRPIELAVAADTDVVCARVRDHGIGMDTNHVRLVFNRFWRADPSRARDTGGSGLGLSLAMEDTRLHGGRLQAWGRPGLGASFLLSLPRRVGTEVRATDLPLALDGSSAVGVSSATGAASGSTDRDNPVSGR